MYDNDYGFPVERRVLATVIETTDRGFGFAQVEGTKMKLYFHLAGKRRPKIVWIPEWWHLDVPCSVLPSVGEEIIFDLIVGYNEIQYWCLRKDFDEVCSLYYDRKKEIRQLAFAGC